MFGIENAGGRLDAAATGEDWSQSKNYRRRRNRSERKATLPAESGSRDGANPPTALRRVESAATTSTRELDPVTGGSHHPPLNYAADRLHLTSQPGSAAADHTGHVAAPPNESTAYQALAATRLDGIKPVEADQVSISAHDTVYDLPRVSAALTPFHDRQRPYSVFDALLAPKPRLAFFDERSHTAHSPLDAHRRGTLISPTTNGHSRLTASRPRSVSVHHGVSTLAEHTHPYADLPADYHAGAPAVEARGFLVDHAMNLFADCSTLTSVLGNLTLPRTSLGASASLYYAQPDLHRPSHADSINVPTVHDRVRSSSVVSYSEATGDLELDTMLRRKASAMSREQRLNSHRRVSGADTLTADLTLKQQFLSMFQPSTDNKLALKLFGSVTAVTKERERIASSKYWVIHPASNFRFYFDLFMLVVLLANLMILPVSIAFFNEDFSIPWIVFNCFSDTIFIIDLVCNFRTGLLNPENASVVILDPGEIAKRYVRSWFFVDLISSIPFDYVVLVISIWDDDFAKSQFVHAGRALRILRMAKLLSLIKLLRLSRLVRYVSQFEEIYFLNIAGVFMRIFNFMALMMLMAHWSGCIQFLVPMLQGFPRDSWVVINELEHASWFEQYTWSFFKAISHQLSIGYGRYPPQSISDAWLTVLSMLTGAFTYALFIGHASNLIHSLDASRRQYREKWKQVEEYMAYRKLPRQLRAKISDFYEHRFQGKMFDEEAILGELNDPLRELIINYNCRDLVSSVPFFSHADPNFVTAVITRLSYEFFLPDDVIVREGTLGDKMYFIQEGLVEIYLEPKVMHEEPAVITCLSDGSYFGEICLLTKAKRVASVRAVTCCSLFSLQSDNFTCVLNEYPLMRTALESVAAERLNKIGKDPGIVNQRSRENLRDEVSSEGDGMRTPTPFPFPLLPTFVDPEAEPGELSINLTAHSPLLTGSTSADALGRRLEAATQQYKYGVSSTPRTLSPSNTATNLRQLTLPGSTSSYQLSPTPMLSPYPDRRLSQRGRTTDPSATAEPPPPSPGGIYMRPLPRHDPPPDGRTASSGKDAAAADERNGSSGRSVVSVDVDVQPPPAASPRTAQERTGQGRDAPAGGADKSALTSLTGPLKLAGNTGAEPDRLPRVWNSNV